MSNTDIYIIFCIILMVSLLLKICLSYSKYKSNNIHNISFFILLIISELINNNILFLLLLALTTYILFNHIFILINSKRSISWNIKSICFIILPFIYYIISYFNYNINEFKNIIYFLYGIYYMTILFVAIFIFMQNIIINRNISKIKLLIPIISIVINSIISTNSITGYKSTIINTIFILIIYIETIEYEVHTDSLTLLNNRYGLDRYIKNKMNKNNSDFYLMMIDINDFKIINDTYGHLMGDEALISLSNIFRKACIEEKINTYCCRYGGDEFLIIINSNDEKRINNYKRFINKELKKLEFPFSLKIAIGFVKYDKSKHYNVKDIISDADNILYINKRKSKTKKYPSED